MALGNLARKWSEESSENSRENYENKVLMSVSQIDPLKCRVQETFINVIIPTLYF